MFAIALRRMTGRRSVAARSVRLMASAIAVVATAAGLVPASGGAQEVTAAPRTHTVVEGNTLWEISQMYLGDPFLWPEVYRVNTDVVEDPHWIFPGEVLLIPEGIGTLAEAPLPTMEAGPAVLPSGPTVFAGGPRRSGASTRSYVGREQEPRTELTPGEFYAAPWVDRNGGPRGSGLIVTSADVPGVSAASARDRFQINDRVYVVAPEGEVVSVGDRYLSYALGPELAGLGQVVIPTGVLEIIEPSNADASVARVVEQYDEITMDQHLVTLEPFAMIAGLRPVPVELGLTAEIVWIPQAPILPSLQSYVVIDASSHDGIAPGDQLTVVLPRRETHDGLHLPEIEIAVAQVVRATPYGATALVIAQEQPAIDEGARVRVTARMP
ncbi:MAG: LysM peptidoglycan-binding domain-containing protein [Gemmatimonadaceae bacterium]